MLQTLSVLKWLGEEILVALTMCYLSMLLVGTFREGPMRMEIQLQSILCTLRNICESNMKVTRGRIERRGALGRGKSYRANQITCGKIHVVYLLQLELKSFSVEFEFESRPQPTCKSALAKFYGHNHHKSQLWANFPP